MPTQKLASEILTAAILGMEVQKEKLDAKIAELKIMLSGGPAVAATPEAPKPKRKMSKEGLARIVAATKKRWAAVRAAKAQQEKAAAKKTAKKKAVKKTAAAAPAVAQVAG